tara:strand:- start:2542 stop:3291 length:750 start_codon:yes stop_codon:yes gene_type:complete
MPRKYSLKFGGGQESEAPIPPVVLIGILLCCVIFLGVASGLIGYFGFVRETCKDKDDDDNFIHEDLCPSGKELKEGTCEGECDESTCCKEYNCNPPTSLPRAYKSKTGQSLSISAFKSVSGFPADISDKVECNTGYSGDPVAISCAGNSNKIWSLGGCEISSDQSSCTDGRNGGISDSVYPRGTPRVLGTCEEVNSQLTHELFGNDHVPTNKRLCDSIYESSGHLCSYQDHDSGDECVTYEQAICTLPG